MQAIVSDPDTVFLNPRSEGAIPLLVGHNTVMTEDGPRMVPVIRWALVH